MIWIYLAYVVVLVAMTLFAQHRGLKSGVAKGYALGVRESRQQQTEIDIVCLCGHGPNFHGPDNGPCDQSVEWRMVGPGQAFDKRTKCRCKRYTGPEILPRVIDPFELEMKKL